MIARAHPRGDRHRESRTSAGARTGPPTRDLPAELIAQLASPLARALVAAWRREHRTTPPAKAGATASEGL